MAVMREESIIVTIDDGVFFCFFFCLSKKRAPVMMRWYDSPVSALPRCRIPSWELSRSQLNPQLSTLMVEGYAVN